MTDQRKLIGRRGEEIAAAFLLGKGFREVARNWSCRAGEIDLIVRRGDEIRFIEVKLRRSGTYGHPEEAITKTKLLHLSRAIEVWLSQQPSPPSMYQADAIAITILSELSPEIVWIEGIL